MPIIKEDKDSKLIEKIAEYVRTLNFRLVDKEIKNIIKIIRTNDKKK